MTKLSILILALMFSPGCLKTRSQLKEEQTIAKENQDKANKEVEIDNLKQEVARLQGKVDELEYQKKENQNSDKQENKKLKDKILELETTLAYAQTDLKKMLEEKKSADEERANKEKEEETAKKKGNNGNDYALGLNQFADGKYKEAAKSFQSYYKNTTKGKYAPDAAFMAGESFFEIKDYKHAIIEYSKITESHPKSKYTTKALYKIVLSFKALNMDSEAKTFAQDLQDKFPNSKEAKALKNKPSKTKKIKDNE